MTTLCTRVIMAAHNANGSPAKEFPGSSEILSPRDFLWPCSQTLEAKNLVHNLMISN